MKEETIQYALEILRKRADDPERDDEARGAYYSAVSILEYAMQDNIECLEQFDY